MENESWLTGKLAGFAPLTMPAAHALAQAAIDLERTTTNLTNAESVKRPNGAPSVAFHLRYIAGSIDRLLTYADNKKLDGTQFDFLKRETDDNLDSSVAELTRKAIEAINHALEFLKNIDSENLFEARFVGRQKLPTNVFGLLFHIAEHTARHVGQIITTAKIVGAAEKLN